MSMEEKEEIDSHFQIRQTLKSVYSELRGIQTEAKFSGIRQQSYNEEVEMNENYNFYMIIVECVLFLVVCFAQLYYVKFILENKRVI